MGYIDFYRESDKKTIRLKLGKIGGVEYLLNGKPDYRKSYPYVEYFGDSVKKLINPNVETDTLKIISADGEIINNPFSVTKREFTQLITGQYENNRITGAIVSNKKGKVYTLQLFGDRAFYTDAESFGQYDIDKETIQVSYEFDDMLLYDYENQYMYAFMQNEVLYTGGAFAPNVPVGAILKIQPIPYLYGRGKRRFSSKPELLKTVDKGGVLGLNTGHLDGNELKLYNQYLNDNRMSNIGDSAYSNFASRPLDASFTNQLCFRDMVKVPTTQITNSIDKDENANPNEDEASDGDSDEEGGKKGDKDDSTDTIPRPPVPDLEITQSIIKMFVLTPTDLRELSANLWSKDTFQQLYNVLSTPIESIISLYMIICDTIPTGNKEGISFGNVESLVDGYPILNSHMVMKSRNLYVPLYYGNFHDYLSSKIKLYLPYCGWITLPNYILGSSINVQYDIDLVSGNALITIAGYLQNVEVVIDRRTVNMVYRLPLSGKDSAQYVGNVWNNPINILTDDSHVQASNIDGNAQYFDVNYPYIIIERTNLALPNNYPNVNGAPAHYYSILSSLTGYTKIEEIQLNIPNCTEYEQKQILNLLMNDGVII